MHCTGRDNNRISIFHAIFVSVNDALPLPAFKTEELISVSVDF
jgi:hypothetical protein